MVSRMFTARLAGVFYLCVAVTGYLSHYVKQAVVAPGNAAATLDRILAHPMLYTLGMASDVIMTAFWIATAVTLYALFRRGDFRLPGIAMVAFVLAGSAAMLAAVLMYLAAWKFAGGGDYLAALVLEQRQALAFLSLEVGKGGVMVASLFFGLWLFPLAYFVWRSGCFPRWVGTALAALLAIAGLGYMADFLFAFFLPGKGIALAQNTFWGELFLLIWLLIKGCGEARNIRHASLEG